MPLQRDFLMRMIERFAAAFFQIVAGKASDAPEQAQLDIEDLLAEALGTKRDFALGLGPAAIDTVEPALAGELSRLLLLHARLSDQLGQHSRAVRARAMGFRAIERALERPGTDFAQLAAEQLQEHFDVVAGDADAAAVHAACLNAHRSAVVAQAWADAEDWLFFALDLNPTSRAVELGGAFYDQLDAIGDDELERGEFSRDEVAEGRAALSDY